MFDFIRGNEIDDVREGFRNIYIGILANTQAHVISATLAHYIVRHGSRFRFSHKFVYIPIAQYEHYFRNTEIRTPIQIEQGGQFRLGSNILNYVKRPVLLEDLCNICFFVQYKNVTLTAKLKDGGDYYRYPEEHPSNKTHCVIDRDDTQPLIPEIPFCLLPDLAKVGSIFPEQGKVLTASDYIIRERYAMFVCFLIFPFRSLSDIQEGKHNKT